MKKYTSLKETSRNLQLYQLHTLFLPPMQRRSVNDQDTLFSPVFHYLLRLNGVVKDWLNFCDFIDIVAMFCLIARDEMPKVL